MRETFSKTVQRGSTRAQWAEEFYGKARKTGRLFLQEGGGSLVYIDPSFGPRRIFTSSDFFGVLHNLVEVVSFRRDENDEWVPRPALLTREETATLFDAPEKATLYTLRAVVFEPMVVPDGPRHRVIEPGYDPASQYFYWVPAGTAPIQPVEGVENLTRAFSGVPFERQGYRANLMAWLLGAVSADPATQTPFLVVDGNQAGLGKTSVVQSAGYILSGSVPSPIEPRGAEFWKGLSSRFVEGDTRVVAMDNIVNSRGGSYDNETLAGLLTQGASKKIRILGQSKTVSAAGIVFCCSLNDAKLSSDLTERSLLVRLFREKNCPMSPFVKAEAMAHRRAIYGELLWLAMQPAPPVPDSVHPNFRFRAWLSFVMPRIEKYFGALAIEESRTLDDATQELFSWGADNSGVPFHSSEFMSRVLAFPEKYPCLHARISSAQSDKGKVISVGRLLAQRVGDIYSIQGTLKIKLVSLPKDEAGNRYSFEELK